MRLNTKTAKQLRAAAEYTNQSRTPSQPVFPGVARLYSAPVYARRPSFSTAYQRVNGVLAKVTTKGTSMAVLARRGREPYIPIEMGEHRYPPTIEIERGGEKVTIEHPKAGQIYYEPKVEILAVTKPVKATGPKAIYRTLKRLAKRGQLAVAAGFDEAAYWAAVNSVKNPQPEAA